MFISQITSYPIYAKTFFVFSSSERQSLDNAHNDEGFFRTFGGLNRQDLTVAIVVMVKKLY